MRICALLGPVVIACLFWGCHETPGQGPAGAASQGPGGEPSAPTPPASAPSALAASDEPAPTLAGSELKVTLSNGATMTLPKIATRTEMTSKAVAQAVEKAHLFKLGHDKRLLMVNELKSDDKTCAQRLDEEWAKMQRVKDDPNEKRLAFRRIGAVEDRTIGETRVLYSEALQRGFFRSEERPYAALASATLCRDGLSVVLMFATDQPALPRGSKAMLEAIATSYTN